MVCLTGAPAEGPGPRGQSAKVGSSGHLCGRPGGGGSRAVRWAGEWWEPVPVGEARVPRGPLRWSAGACPICLSEPRAPRWPRGLWGAEPAASLSSWLSCEGRERHSGCVSPRPAGSADGGGRCCSFSESEGWRGGSPESWPMTWPGPCWTVSGMRGGRGGGGGHSFLGKGSGFSLLTLPVFSLH